MKKRFALLFLLLSLASAGFSQSTLPLNYNLQITPSSGGPLTDDANGNKILLTKIGAAYVFGDSYQAGVGVLNYQDSMIGLLQRDIPAPVYNFAVPGAVTPQYVTRAYGNFIPDPIFRTVSILGGAENDANLDACSACANSMTHYRNTESALVAWQTIPFSNRQMASNSVATSGTWSAEVGVPLSANYQLSNPGSAVSATTVGAVRTFTVATTTATSEIGINFNVCNISAGCGSFTVSIDGTNVTDDCSGTTTFTAKSCVAFANSQTEGVYREEYTVTPATSHTVVFTITAAGYVVPNSVDWIVPNSLQNNIVYQFATNAAWTNYAAYNVTAGTVLSGFQAHGIPAYFVDIVNGVSASPWVPGTYAVNSTTDLSTTALQPVLAHNLPIIRTLADRNITVRLYRQPSITIRSTTAAFCSHRPT